MDMSQQTTSHEEISRRLDAINDTKMTPEMKLIDDNLEFENKALENPLPSGVGTVNVFNCETWDINAILKGNYWGRSIYTTDKICKLFLKWNLERQKKYLRKRNPMDFDWTWILLLVIIGVVALLAIIFLLPQLGGAI